MRLAAALHPRRLSIAVPAASAKTLRWSSQGDYLTADPHAQNEGINNLINDEIFERLTARDKQLRLVPSLATSWEQASPTLWRFHLRNGVSFHDGTPLTADDVVFSIVRAQTSELQLQGVRDADRQAAPHRRLHDRDRDRRARARRRSSSRT